MLYSLQLFVYGFFFAVAAAASFYSMASVVDGEGGNARSEVVDLLDAAVGEKVLDCAWHLMAFNGICTCTNVLWWARRYRIFSSDSG